MFETYKKRVGKQGSTMGEILRNQSNDIMDQTFTNDTAYKLVKINNVCVDAKFKKHNSYSILKDYVDHYLQFRPHVAYPVGTYVYIPDEAEVYQPWFIVGLTEDIHFIRHLCISCNFSLKWIKDDKIYSVLGAIRSRNSYNSGLWTSDYSTSPENEIGFWCPSTEISRMIDYDQRFMITDNSLHPLVYSISKREDMVPFGIVKFTLTQTDYDEKRDNVDLRLCDYYKTDITPTEVVTPTDGYSKITYTGSSKALQAGGSSKTYSAVFYDAKGNILSGITPVWDYSSFGSNFIVTASGDSVKIKALTHTQGSIGTLKITNEGYASELSVEVIGL